MKILVLSLLLISCANQPVKVTYTDGREGYLVSCYEPLGNCRKQADKLCPYGHTEIEINLIKSKDKSPDRFEVEVACQENMAELDTTNGYEL